MELSSRAYDPEVEALIEAEALKLILPPNNSGRISPPRGTAANGDTVANGNSDGVSTIPSSFLHLLVQVREEQKSSEQLTRDSTNGRGNRPSCALQYIAEWKPEKLTKIDAAYRRCLRDRAAAKAKRDEKDRLEREEEDRECTFQPKISESSKGMARSAGGDSGFYDAGQEWLKKRERKAEAKLAKEKREAAAVEKEEMKKFKVSKKNHVLAGRVDATPLSPPRGYTAQRLRGDRVSIANTADAIKRPTFSPVIGDRSKQLAHKLHQGDHFLDRMQDDVEDRELRKNAWENPVTTLKLSGGEMDEAVERLYNPPQRYFKREDSQELAFSQPTFSPQIHEYVRPHDAPLPRSKEEIALAREALFDETDLYAARAVVLPQHEIDDFVERSDQWLANSNSKRKMWKEEKEREELEACTFRPEITNYELQSMHAWQDATPTISSAKKAAEFERSLQQTPRSSRKCHPKVQPYTPDGWQLLHRNRTAHTVGGEDSPAGGGGYNFRDTSPSSDGYNKLRYGSNYQTRATTPTSKPRGVTSPHGVSPVAATAANQAALVTEQDVDDWRQTVKELKAWFDDIQRTCGGDGGANGGISSPTKTSGWIPRAAAAEAFKSLAQGSGTRLSVDFEHELNEKIQFADFVHVYNKLMLQ